MIRVCWISFDFAPLFFLVLCLCSVCGMCHAVSYQKQLHRPLFSQQSSSAERRASGKASLYDSPRLPLT